MGGDELQEEPEGEEQVLIWPTAKDSAVENEQEGGT